MFYINIFAVKLFCLTVAHNYFRIICYMVNNKFRKRIGAPVCEDTNNFNSGTE